VGVGAWLERVQPKFFNFLHGRPSTSAPAAEPPPGVGTPAQPVMPQPAPPLQPESPPSAVDTRAPGQAQASVAPPAQAATPIPAVGPPPESPPADPGLGGVTLRAPTLVIQSGTLAGQRIPIAAQVSLGRENADVVLDDPEVSRQHARITWNLERLELSDLGSANGTFVNGQRITASHDLQDGDVVRLGQVTFAIELPPARDPGATVISPG
jgi:ABC transport system ATP-binding/permease protein